MDIDKQLLLNAIRDMRAARYARKCANRKPTPPAPKVWIWTPLDAAGLQDID